MISLSRLNKLIISVIFFTVLNINSGFTEDKAADIWEEKNEEKQEGNEVNEQKEITIKSPILSDDISKIVIGIDEEKIDKHNQNVIGILDPKDKIKTAICGKKKHL